MAQMAQLEEVLRSLRDRQQKALDETRRIKEKVRLNGSLTRSEAASLLDLARNQRLLESEAEGMARKAAGAEVLHLALTSAVEKMHEAAALLDSRQPGGETQEAQQAALKWLDQVLEALKKIPQAPGGPQAGGTGGPQPGKPPGAQNPGRALRNFVQIKLVKLMQLDLNDQSRKAEQQALQGGAPADQARKRLAELAAQQGRLAILLLKLLPAEDAHAPPGDPEPEDPQ